MVFRWTKQRAPTTGPAGAGRVVRTAVAVERHVAPGPLWGEEEAE